MRYLGIVIAWCLAASSSFAAEWAFDLPLSGGAEQLVTVASDALVDAGSLRVTWLADGNDPDAPSRWLEVAIITADGRWFTSAAPPIVMPGDSGRRDWRLDASAWSSDDGRFGGDASQAVQAIRVCVHGAQGPTALHVDVTTVAAGSLGSLAVEQVGTGLIERIQPDGTTLWSEWRVRLGGDPRAERGSLSFVGSDLRIPAFLEQPGNEVGGRWQAQGPARWVFRLRPGESAINGHLEWRWRDQRWQSATVMIPASIVGKEPLSSAPQRALVIDQVPEWQANEISDQAGVVRHIATTTVPTALAPILRWRADWGDFRGLNATAHRQAQALDAHLGGSIAAIDLLPQGLAEEQGAFRFGLNPIRPEQGGDCHYVQDLWSPAGHMELWVDHARDIMARCRAVPGLQCWTLGMDTPANDAEQLQRLYAVVAEISAETDHRPFYVRHPQLVPYRYRAEDPPWCSFERGNDGWEAVAWTGLGKVERVPGGSDGERALRLPLSQGPVRMTAVQRYLDANIVNLDRVEFDVRFSAPESAAVQWYAWVTDRHHRWYQTPVHRLLGSPRWTTIGFDLGAEAHWQPVGHTIPWDGDQRRQIRMMGIAAFVHGAQGVEVDLQIDRIRRLGWPESAPPQLAITDVNIVSEPTARTTPISVDFACSIAARNPYDPESADVVGEVQGPDGKTLTYPAFWSEPMELRFDHGLEEVLPLGAGSWHWRFSPPTPGVWKWRLRAKMAWRDSVLETTTDWHTSTVPESWPAMPMVRPDPKDARWWQRDDGQFWYPLGLNMRSPGDTRQDKVLEEFGAGLSRQRADAVDPLTASLSGWNSDQFERLGTVAFDRWLRRCSQNGINWARVWMCPWWCGLEWSRQWDEFGGLVVYNQHSAARLDRVLDIAAREGVYIQLELQNHGMTSEFVDQQWKPDSRGNPGSPYSTRNGGPCRSAADFYRSEDAWKIHAKRLRYTLARWGWRSQVAAFVLSSEMEFTGDWKDSGAFADEDNGLGEATQKWIERSLAWWRENDPMQRSISVHFSHPWRASRVWTMPGLAFSNSNAYTGFQDVQRRLGGPGAGLDRAFEVYLTEHFPPQNLKRPTLIGEWGGHWERNSSDRLAAELHTGLWMQAVMPFGGNTGFWWWLWIDVSDTWSEYAAVAHFIAEWDPRGEAFHVDRPRVDRSLEVMGMVGTHERRCYVWQRGLSRSLTQPALPDGGNLRWETGEANVTWHWERWETRGGTVIAQGDVTTNARGMVVLPLGAVDRDAAFVLRRK